MLRNQVGISNDLASLLYCRSSAEIITSRTLLSGDNNFTDAGQLVRCHDTLQCHILRTFEETHFFNHGVTYGVLSTPGAKKTSCYVYTGLLSSKVQLQVRSLSHVFYTIPSSDHSDPMERCSGTSLGPKGDRYSIVGCIARIM
jgi:hypothetical protein